MKRKIKIYAISILIALAVGGLSALVTGKNMNLYETINQPPLAPPGILFPIVWTILYILMGISSARIFMSETSEGLKKVALQDYALNLFFNFAWSIFFFNFRVFVFSFIWIVILWGIIIKMIYDFYKIDKPAAFLQIPYLLWVTFAMYLNLGIIILN